MSRPKHCAYEESARGRIEAAFWHILKEEGFHAVTMLRLAREAGLNRNTVYYHFPHVQAVALSSFRRIFADEESRLFVDTVLSGQELSPFILGDPVMRSNIGKLHLFAKSGSPLLNAILRDSLKQVWFSRVGIVQEDLSPVQRIQVEYILSGLISIIGSREFIRDPSVLRTFPQALIGRAAIHTLKELAAGR